MPSARTTPVHNTMTRRDVLKQGARVAGALGLSTMWAGCGGGGARRDWPNIVLITLDTTRADHLGCYGYERNTSANLDRFAERARIYDRCIAPSTWTLPSHASLFTGKLPSSHGARKDPNGPLRFTQGVAGPESWNIDRVRSIAADQQTLAGLLSDAGYQTLGLVSGPWLKPIFGLHKGFDHYDDRNITTINGRIASDVTDSALRVLDQVKTEPWFMFLNYFDPHPPYEAPGRYRLMFVPPGTKLPKTGEKPSDELRRDVYDAEVFYMDIHLGRLLDGLKQRGQFDDAWIIITADHGHLLGEHGMYGHADTPYQEVAHLPMIIKEPGMAMSGGRTDQWIQLIDLMPMITDRLDIALPPGVQGERPDRRKRPLITESRTLPPLKVNGSWTAIFEGDMKYIANTQGRNMLFNLAVDPSEQNNLLNDQPDLGAPLAGKMVAYLASLPEPGPPGPTTEIDAKTLETLRSLGYLQ